MRYIDAVRGLDALVSFQGIKPGLERIERLLALLGDPHRSFQVVHIAGTNGKGTVARMISSGLSTAGLIVGEYTSPHLVSYCERFCINGVQISPAVFARSFERIMKVAGQVEGITEFEVLTAMAFEWFEQKQVDVAVVETGLGGRYDATNVVTPLVSVITSIGYDHQSILGNTLAEIAYEKGGIIKPGVPVVTGILPQEAQKEIQRIARQKNSPVIRARPVRMRTRMLGMQQQINCGMAMAVQHIIRKTWGISKIKYSSGVRHAFLRGRLQVIKKHGKPVLVLDGGHNEEASVQLAKNLRVLFPRAKKIFIIGILKRKDARVILKNILGVADTVILTSPNNEYHSVKTLQEHIPQARVAVTYACPKLKTALTLAKSVSGRNAVICISGSFYLIGEFLKGH